MMRAASALHAATRAAKAKLEAPSVGAIARERLVERGARVEMQRPTFGDFARNHCEGRAGHPTRSGPHTPMLRPTPSRAEAWRTRRSARLLRRYVIDVSCDQGRIPILYPSCGHRGGSRTVGPKIRGGHAGHVDHGLQGRIARGIGSKRSARLGAQRIAQHRERAGCESGVAGSYSPSCSLVR